MAKKAARRSVKKSVKRTTRTTRTVTPVSVTTSAPQPTASGPTELGAIFFLTFIINSIVIYLANMFFPTMVVLGNARYTAFSALLISMFAVALVSTLAVPVVEGLVASARVKLGMMHWSVIYLLLNSAILWVVARYAEMFGLGIASWGVVVLLAFILTALQGMAITQIVYGSRKG
jgi:hypothetical protein